MATWYEAVDAYLGGLLIGGVSPMTPFGSTVEEAAAGGVSGVGARPVFAARGKNVTISAVLPPGGGAPIPTKIVPGGVAMYSRDLTAAKRAKRVGRTINRLFPRPRRAPAKRKR